jgi:hypothetical protein
MIIRHVNQRHNEWKDIIDYETFWILTVSTVVLSGGLLALFSIAQSNLNALP